MTTTLLKSDNVRLEQPLFLSKDEHSRRIEDISNLRFNTFVKETNQIIKLSAFDVEDFVKKIDLSKFLKVSNAEYLKCIFEEIDNNYSATIYKNNNNHY